MRSRAQRKDDKLRKLGITQRELDERKLRFCMLVYNQHYGPDATAKVLFRYQHLFQNEGIFRDAAKASWDLDARRQLDA